MLKTTLLKTTMHNYIAVLLRIGATSLKFKVNILEISCPVEYLREELDTYNPCLPS